jgi:hypothetical protein
MSVGSWINSGLGLAGNLARRVPGRVWVAVGCLLVAALWVAEHDARIRRQARLQQLQQQTSAEVAALKMQAEQDVQQANVKNAKALHELEARRLQLAQQNQKLAAQLDALRKQAQIQAEQVATLPISEIVTRVAAQLGLQSQDVAAKEPPVSRKAANAQSKLQITNDELPKAAGKGAGATAPPDKSGYGPAEETTPHPAAGAATLSPGRGPDHASFADAAANGVALALTGSGVRKAETALVELNACRAESQVENQQVANCQAQAKADDATIQRLNDSVATLNQALGAKDKILSRQASACKAELKAAKGTFLGRLWRVTTHVAIGVAVGVAVR